jgi:hypothetical protein
VHYRATFPASPDARSGGHRHAAITDLSGRIEIGLGDAHGHATLTQAQADMPIPPCLQDFLTSA